MPPWTAVNTVVAGSSARLDSMSAGLVSGSAVPEIEATVRSVRSASDPNRYDAHSSSPDRPESRAEAEIPAATPPRLCPPTAHRGTPGDELHRFPGGQERDVVRDLDDHDEGARGADLPQLRHVGPRVDLAAGQEDQPGPRGSGGRQHDAGRRRVNPDRRVAAHGRDGLRRGGGRYEVADGIEHDGGREPAADRPQHGGGAVPGTVRRDPSQAGAHEEEADDAYRGQRGGVCGMAGEQGTAAEDGTDDGTQHPQRTHQRSPGGGADAGGRLGRGRGWHAGSVSRRPLGAERGHPWTPQQTRSSSPTRRR
jgi:hypothetical protein